MPKRIYLHLLEKHDRDHHTSYVRELEMAVESLCLEVGDQRYQLQFWKDVATYGISEAKTYLLRWVDSLGRSAYVSQDIIDVSAKIEEIHCALAREYVS